MAVPTVMNDLSTTPGNNSPAGSESPISTDDFHRAIQAILRTTNAKGADIASAATTDIGAATGEFVDVTGTTTITALGTIGAGITRTVRFTGALTLTHNGTSLILPGSANITTANGDCAIFRSLGSGNWKCIGYFKQNGQSLATGDDSVTSAALADSSQGFSLINGTITATVGSNALTIAIKTLAGADPSSTSPVLCVFRSSTLTSGVYVVRSITAATSVVVSSGSTLGTVSGVQSQINVLAIDNAGTVELAVVNNAGYLDLPETGVISTTAEGGAGAADSVNTIYSTTARSNVAYRNIAFVVSTQATAGTWASSPTVIALVRNAESKSAVINYAAQSASGTSIDFSSIPSWVTNLAVNFSGFSSSGTSVIQVRLGDAGGIEDTGYLGSVTEPGTATVNLSSGFSISNNNTAAAVWHGQVMISRLGTSNSWAANCSIGRSDAGAVRIMGGSKALSDVLTTVRITTAGGTDTFDAGTVSLNAW